MRSGFLVCFAVFTAFVQAGGAHAQERPGCCQFGDPFYDYGATTCSDELPVDCLRQGGQPGTGACDPGSGICGGTVPCCQLPTDSTNSFWPLCSADPPERCLALGGTPGLGECNYEPGYSRGECEVRLPVCCHYSDDSSYIEEWCTDQLPHACWASGGVPGIGHCAGGCAVTAQPCCQLPPEDGYGARCSNDDPVTCTASGGDPRIGPCDSYSQLCAN